MEKKVKGLIALSCLSVLAMGAIVGVAASKEAGLIKNELPNIRAAQTPVSFETANITRRFYFVNNDNWWTSDTLEIHVWGGSLVAEQWVQASKMYDSYNYGLYYADITGVGIGAAVNAQIHVKGSAGDYSVGRLLPSLADKTGDVMWLNSGLTDGNRNMTLGTAGGTSGQVASFINFISTCTDSYASGYNAYPQLNANFFVPSAGEISSYGDGTYVNDKDDEDHNYTLNQKIAELSKQYTKNGWIVE